MIPVKDTQEELVTLTDNSKEDDKQQSSVEFQVTTREELWAKVYQTCLDFGFSEEKAVSESDKVVNKVFDELLPEGAEEELRQLSQTSDN